jgi:hypothetical protein
MLPARCAPRMLIPPIMAGATWSPLCHKGGIGDGSCPTYAAANRAGDNTIDELDGAPNPTAADTTITVAQIMVALYRADVHIKAPPGGRV